MMDILEEYKNYVPSKASVLEEPIPRVDSTEDTVIDPNTGGWRLPLCCMCKGSRSSSDLKDGIIPVAEDWHAKACLLEVSIVLILRHSQTIAIAKD